MIASEILPQEFNVATYFVDRNVAEGRGSPRRSSTRTAC